MPHTRSAMVHCVIAPEGDDHSAGGHSPAAEGGRRRPPSRGLFLRRHRGGGGGSYAIPRGWARERPNAPMAQGLCSFIRCPSVPRTHSAPVKARADPVNIALDSHALSQRPQSFGREAGRRPNGRQASPQKLASAFSACASSVGDERAGEGTGGGPANDQNGREASGRWSSGSCAFCGCRMCCTRSPPAAVRRLCPAGGGYLRPSNMRPSPHAPRGQGPFSQAPTDETLCRSCASAGNGAVVALHRPRGCSAAALPGGGGVLLRGACRVCVCTWSCVRAGPYPQKAPLFCGGTRARQPPHRDDVRAVPRKVEGGVLGLAGQRPPDKRLGADIEGAGGGGGAALGERPAIGQRSSTAFGAPDV